MNFIEILRHSWKITREHQTIWWLGVISLFVGGFDIFYSFDEKSIENIGINLNITEIGLTLLIFTILGLFLFYFGYAAYAGNIKYVQTLEHEKKSLSIKTSIKKGKSYFWRIIGMNILIVLFAICGLIPLLVLIVLSTNPNDPSMAVISLAVIWAVSYILYMLYIAISICFGIVQLVLNNSTIDEAFREGRRLLKKQFKNSFKSICIIVILGFFEALTLEFLIYIFYTPGQIIWMNLTQYMSYYLAGLAIAPLAILCTLIYIIVAGFLNGFITTYLTYSVVTLEHLSDKGSH